MTIQEFLNGMTPSDLTETAVEALRLLAIQKSDDQESLASIGAINALAALARLAD